MCTHIYDWVFMYIRLYVHYFNGCACRRTQVSGTSYRLRHIWNRSKRRNIHVHDSKWYVFVSLSYIAYCFLHIVHCLLPVAFCLLPLASCPLCFAYRIANVFFLYCLSLTVLPLLPVLPIAYCLMLIAYCKQSPIYTHLYTYTRKTIFIYTHIPTGHIWATENTQYNEITFSRVWAPPDYNICTLAHTHANN